MRAQADEAGVVSMGQAWPYGRCRWSAGPVLGSSANQARRAFPNPTPRPELGRNNSTPQHPKTVGSKTALHLPPA